MQVVHLHERNSGGVVYPAYDGGVVTRWKVCDDRRFTRVPRSVAAVLNVLDLVLGDFHKSHLFFLSLCIRAIRGRCCVFCLTRLHIEVAFTSSLLRDSRKIFGEQPLMDTNRHEGGGPEKPLIVQITRIWERSPRRPCLKAWPSLPSVAAASSPKQSSSPRSTRRYFE